MYSWIVGALLPRVPGVLLEPTQLNRLPPPSKSFCLPPRSPKRCWSLTSRGSVASSRTTCCVYPSISCDISFDPADPLRPESLVRLGFFAILLTQHSPQSHSRHRSLLALSRLVSVALALAVSRSLLWSLSPSRTLGRLVYAPLRPRTA